jgi:hypothetical protein
MFSVCNIVASAVFAGGERSNWRSDFKGFAVGAQEGT